MFYHMHLKFLGYCTSAGSLPRPLRIGSISSPTTTTPPATARQNGPRTSWKPPWRDMWLGEWLRGRNCRSSARNAENAPYATWVSTWIDLESGNHGLRHECHMVVFLSIYFFFVPLPFEILLQRCPNMSQKRIKAWPQTLNILNVFFRFIDS